ncbi:ATP-binding cassette domain-containing protein [Fibrella aquatica]|uniref:ATP-binding cassette domain-containing protein n=1 Tax=Fibrella aquatica TaxID=3242487 RepID=UPI003522AD3B
MHVIKALLQLIGNQNRNKFFLFLLLFLFITLVSFVSTSCLFLLTSLLLTGKTRLLDLPFTINRGQTLILLCVVSIISLIVQEVVDYFTQLRYLAFRERARAELATTYLSNILSLDIDDYFATNYTHYIRICYHSSQNIILLLHAFKEAVVALFSIILSVLLLGRANSWVLLFLALVFVVQFVLKFNRRHQADLTTLGFQSENIAKKYTSYLDDLFNIYKEIKVFNRGATMINRADEQLRLVAQSNLVLNRRYIVGGNHLRSFLISGMLIGIIIMEYVGLNVLEVVPILVLVLLLVQRIAPAANAIHLFATNVNTSNYLIHEQQELSQKVPSTTVRGVPIYSFELIEVDQARFAYGERTVFADLSFSIRRNTIVGIVGESGRGKTTFIELLAGLKEYNQARIKINGETITSFRQLSPMISFVSQRIYLINDTLRNNLTLFNGQFSDEDIWYALEQVNLKHYFYQLADQLDTVILKGGTNLSVGQAQRIGLARALLYKSDLLIMDEFTASLDYENKMQICAILVKLKAKVTIVVSTHDTDIQSIFDQTITL